MRSIVVSDRIYSVGWYLDKGIRKPVSLNFGGVAQLGEHLLCKQGVRSSILLISTKGIRRIRTKTPIRIAQK